MKRVLDVGNCPPDHSAIRHFVEREFGAEVVQAHGPDDTMQALRDGKFDLVLVNRKLDQDYSDGLEIIKAMKSSAELRETPVMLITNYDEHQQAAIAVGAERGFGKLEIGDDATVARLQPFLANDHRST